MCYLCFQKVSRIVTFRLESGVSVVSSNSSKGCATEIFNKGDLLLFILAGKGAHELTVSRSVTVCSQAVWTHIYSQK